jgi:hypothetical protein
MSPTRDPKLDTMRLFGLAETPNLNLNIPVLPSAEEFEGAADRLGRMTVYQFQQAATAGPVAVECVLADIRSVLNYARFRP